MRVLIVALLVGLCAWQTHARAFDWRSDQALWTAATVTAPTLPRPWLNLAHANLSTGQWDQAWRHLRRAVTLAQQPAFARGWPGLRSVARSQLLWLDAIEPRCEQPSWRALCASLE